MFWKVPFLLLVFCLVVNSCKKALPSEQIKRPKAKPLLPSTVQQLLKAQQHSYTTFIKLLTKKEFPQPLPPEKDYWQALHYNALLAGKKQLLYKHYQQINAPQYHAEKHVDLSYQNIRFLPDYIGNCQALQYLSLSNNQLKALNPQLQYCQQLLKLDLSSNGLTTLPQGLSYLHQLEELILTDNSISDLPAFLRQLRNLKVLDLSNLHRGAANYYNTLSSLPSIVLQMPQLERLFLEKLNLRTLPTQLHQLNTLKIISLNGNRTLNLNQSFTQLAKLPSLLALDLSFIGKRTLPSSIKKLQHLKVLVWHEENQANRAFVENTLKTWLPYTQIYYGKKDVATPFLRGNAIATLQTLTQ